MERNPVSFSSKKPALKNQRLQRRKPRRDRVQLPQRRLNSSPLERRLERSKLYTFRLVMLAIFVFGVSYTVCLLLLPDHPGSFTLGSVTNSRQIWLSHGPRVVISVSMALLSMAVLMHLRTRLISRQVDILCRQFLSFRREHEQGELEIPSKTEIRTGMELRVMMLRELWNRFQKTQEALALNLTELENSKVQLEQTVDSLKRAKAHERRLVELGYAVAEFGHDIGNANGSILSFCTLVLKMFEKDLVSTMDLVRALTYIRRIKHSSVNISGLTGDIVEFAAEAEAGAAPVDETEKKEAAKPEEPIVEDAVQPEGATKTDVEEINPDSTTPTE